MGGFPKQELDLGAWSSAFWTIIMCHSEPDFLGFASRVELNVTEDIHGVRQGRGNARRQGRPRAGEATSGAGQARRRAAPDGRGDAPVTARTKCHMTAAEKAVMTLAVSRRRADIKAQQAAARRVIFDPSS